MTVRENVGNDVECEVVGYLAVVRSYGIVIGLRRNSTTRLDGAGGCSEFIMPQPRDVTKPPIGQRRCPKCGLPMFLSEIEATASYGEDLRTFECQLCSYAETVTVQFQSSVKTLSST